jgi:ketosteroid isomerase-like protein
LQELLDREAIRDLIHRYCRAIDRCDAELLTSCYHEDAIEDHGGLFYGSRDEWVSFVIEDLRGSAATTHMTSNLSIELDGDRAYAESYVLAAGETLPTADGAQLLLLGGRYIDRFARREGEWRIVKRVLVVDWSHIQPLTPAFGDGAADPAAAQLTIRRGLRSHEDPAYPESARKLLA